MSKLTKQIKELTGEDAVDIFGGDAENIVEELNRCEHCYCSFIPVYQASTTQGIAHKKCCNCGHQKKI